MTVKICVYRFGILVQIGNGMLHRYYDWIMVLDLIRPEDTVFVQMSIDPMPIV